MPRPSFRKSVTLESLERREVLSAAADPMSQYALSLMNLARTNPQAASTWLGNEINGDINLQLTLNHYNVDVQQKLSQLANATPQAPLAWNVPLANAAQGHSQDMQQNGFQSHTGSDGSSPGDRISNAGFGATASSGEDAFAYASSTENAIEAFLLDWGVSDDGHYRNIMQPGTAPQDAYDSVGVGIVRTPNSVGQETDVVTVDFAKGQNTTPQVVGVVYDDSNGNGVYDPGEGQGGVTIQAQNLATGQVSSTTSASAGGYQIALANGNYDIKALGSNGQVLSSQNVSINGLNASGDFNLLSPTTASSQYAPPPPEGAGRPRPRPRSSRSRPRPRSRRRRWSSRPQSRPRPRSTRSASSPSGPPTRPTSITDARIGAIDLADGPANRRGRRRWGRPFLAGGRRLPPSPGMPRRRIPARRGESLPSRIGAIAEPADHAAPRMTRALCLVPSAL